MLHLKKYQVNFSLALENIHVTVNIITSKDYNDERRTTVNSFDLKTWENKNLLPRTTYRRYSALFPSLLIYGEQDLIIHGENAVILKKYPFLRTIKY